MSGHIVRPCNAGGGSQNTTYRVTITIASPGTYALGGAAVNLGITWANAGDHTQLMADDLWAVISFMRAMVSLQSYVSTSTDGPGAGLHSPVAALFRIYGVNSAGADIALYASATLNPGEVTDFTAAWTTQPNGLRFELAAIGAGKTATVIVPATIVLEG